MRHWDQLARSPAGLVVAISGILLIPLAGIVMLRFLLSGPPIDHSAAAPAPPPPPAVRATLEPAPGASVPTVFPAATATPTASPTAPRPTPPPTPEARGRVNASDGLNVRVEPTTRSDVLRILSFKTEVELSGRERFSEGLVWVELDDGGWVQNRYLDR